MANSLPCLCPTLTEPSKEFPKPQIDVILNFDN